MTDLQAENERLRKALEYYADPEHWRTKNASESLANTGYGMGYHRTNPDGQIETLAAHCGHWVASKHMVHGGHWQADAGHVARQALRQAPALAGGEAVKVCATEGCENAATVHFGQGGVGSDYCAPCYLKVQAISHAALTHPAPVYDNGCGEAVAYLREDTLTHVNGRKVLRLCSKYDRGAFPVYTRPDHPDAVQVTKAMVDAFKRAYRAHLDGVPDDAVQVDFKALEREAVCAALEAALQGAKA